MAATSAGDVVAETERLLIRPWRLAEAPRVLDIQSRIEVIKWLGDGEPVPMADLDEARERIERYHARSRTRRSASGRRGARDRGGRGSVLLLTLPNAEPGEVEIGWHLHPDSWGRGYASEAAAAVLRPGSTTASRGLGAHPRRQLPLPGCGPEDRDG